MRPAGRGPGAAGALGVLARLRAPTGSIRRIHISRRGDFGRSLLDAARYGREEFGRIVVARDFGEALEARLAELPRLHRYRPVRFVGLADGEDGWRAIRVADGAGERVLRARLLVAADGTRSGVREACAIAADEYDYGQTLFVTRLRCERAPDGTAYERLGDEGPTALLPRGDRHYGLIHGVANADAAAVARSSSPRSSPTRRLLRSSEASSGESAVRRRRVEEAARRERFAAGFCSDAAGFLVVFVPGSSVCSSAAGAVASVPAAPSSA